MGVNKQKKEVKGRKSASYRSSGVGERELQGAMPRKQASHDLYSASSHVPDEPINSDDYDDPGMFKEEQQEIRGVFDDSDLQATRVRQGPFVPDIDGARYQARVSDSSGKAVDHSHGRNSHRAERREVFERRKKAAEDEVLAVIEDQRNGHTFYVSIIDNFRYRGTDYAVMYNYRAEEYQKTMPEIIIMRSYRDSEKQFFTSIRDKSELDAVFDVFYERFQQSN